MVNHSCSAGTGGRSAWRRRDLSGRDAVATAVDSCGSGRCRQGDADVRMGWKRSRCPLGGRVNQAAAVRGRRGGPTIHQGEQRPPGLVTSAETPPRGVRARARKRRHRGGRQQAGSGDDTATEAVTPSHAEGDTVHHRDGGERFELKRLTSRGGLARRRRAGR